MKIIIDYDIINNNDYIQLSEQTIQYLTNTIYDNQ